jgi:RimJ/RimL family protein N-acetyltransferase
MSKPSVSSDLKKKIKMNSAKPKYMDIFVICVGNECAGMITLGEIIRDHKAWIGYWLGSDYRGKGIMTLAIKKITDYGFKRYKLRRIEASVATFNKASTIILEKCGYKLEGTMKKNRLKNGKYYDEYLYAITRP